MIHVEAQWWLWYLIFASTLLILLAVSSERKRTLSLKEYSKSLEYDIGYGFGESNELPTTDLEGNPLDIDFIQLRRSRILWDKISTALYSLIMASAGLVILLIQYEVLRAPWWVGLASVAYIFCSAFLVRRTWKLLKES
ncbi:MAG: hypothetical protein QXI59_01500 [Candidatus Bathyarchaeia archaeon]